MTTEKKHKKGFRCERAEKSVNYQRKAKILLCFRFKLKQRDQLPTAENCFQFEKRSGHCNYGLRQENDHRDYLQKH